MGKLVYDFVQKLDPLIYLYHKITDFVTWKHPYKTIGVGICLTLMIYNIKMAIFLAGFLLFFGKAYIFKRLFKFQKYSTVQNRLIIPQENAVFLQNGMENYCHIYEKGCEFLFS